MEDVSPQELYQYALEKGVTIEEPSEEHIGHPQPQVRVKKLYGFLNATNRFVGEFLGEFCGGFLENWAGEFCVNFSWKNKPPAFDTLRKNRGRKIHGKSRENQRKIPRKPNGNPTIIHRKRNTPTKTQPKHIQHPKKLQ